LRPAATKLEVGATVDEDGASDPVSTVAVGGALATGSTCTAIGSMSELRVSDASS